MPLLVAVSSILTTFLCVLGLTYVTDVSIIVQFLVALVGLGIAIDYSLLMIFRFREEIAHGRTTDDAIVETMQHAGRSVIVSGSTVAIGLVSMVILPLPFIRSIGLGGMLIPLVSVLASITLTPSLLRILGPKINRVRVMPKRLLSNDDVGVRLLDALGRASSRGGRSSIFLLGMVVVVLLLIPALKINPSDAETARQPASADAAAGRQALDRRGHHARASSSRSPSSSRARAIRRSWTRSRPPCATTGGIEGVTAPTGDAWRRGDAALLEAFSTTDASSKASRKVISNLQDTRASGRRGRGGRGRRRHARRRRAGGARLRPRRLRQLRLGARCS